MSQIFTQAFHPLEYRHGPISLVDERTRCGACSTARRSATPRPSSRGEMQDKGALVIGFGGPGDVSLRLDSDRALTGLACLPALQMLGERAAQARNIDTVAPRHLTKVVMLALSRPACRADPIGARLALMRIPVLAASLFVLTCGAAFAAGQPAASQAAPQPQSTSAVYGDWTLRCVMVAVQPQGPAAPGAAPTQVRHCEIDQGIAITGQPQPIAQIAVGADIDKGGMRLAAQLPIGSWLPTAPAIRTGPKAAPTPLAFKRCLPNACIADTGLSDALLEALQIGTDTGQLSFQMVAGKDVNLPISLNGFSAAYTALLQTP